MPFLTIPNSSDSRTVTQSRTETTSSVISSIVRQQRCHFNTGQTLPIPFRIEQLQRLKQSIEKHEQQISEALYNDLRKSHQESYLTEISIVKQELNLHIKRLKTWTRPRIVRTPFHLFPSTSKMTYQPLGIALIIAPWNYPFQLLMNPLIGAISSGCCAILKTSPLITHTNRIMEFILAECFDPAYITLVQGGKTTVNTLLNERYDIIFCTGSSALGKKVMQAAAEHLTPVILELGGKSPCIVDETANIAIAARRIAWGKTLNAGQTCVAPDYLLVHERVKDELLAAIAVNLRAFYGEECQKSPHYARIINSDSFERLTKLLENGTIVYGGKSDKDDLYIEPTLLDDISSEDPIMQQEIFGPILPVISFSDIQESIHYVNKQEKPLAAYFFGSKKKARLFQERTSSGGLCINDTMLHLANHHLPFGGVGQSGMGSYHGRNSFLAFSHKRPVLCTTTRFDLTLRYAPFRYFKWVRKIV